MWCFHSFLLGLLFLIFQGALLLGLYKFGVHFAIFHLYMFGLLVSTTVRRTWTSKPRRPNFQQFFTEGIKSF